MPIVPQYSTETTDGSGDTVFMFPDVPMGQLWCGTTTVPGAPATFIGTVTASGLRLGQMNGPGSYGPWTCDHSQRLAIVATGLDPDTQYQAVWHADDRGAEFSTYPSPITPTVTGGISGTVDIGNFPAIQTVDGTVSTAPTLAGAAPAGQVTVSPGGVTLPPHTATAGVTLAAPLANANPVTIGSSGLVLDPGHLTPLLPVSNSDVFTAFGTSPDVLSFLVT